MKSIRIKWRILALTGLLLLLASVAQAQSCGISTNTVDFGSYNFLDAIPLKATGTIEVTCPAGTGYEVMLGPGQHPGSSRPFRPRFLHHVGGRGILHYQLYTNFARTLVWGDGVHSNTTLCTQSTCTATEKTRRVGSSDVTTRQFKVFGKLAMRQNVWQGTYKDLVTVTVQY